MTEHSAPQKPAPDAMREAIDDLDEIASYAAANSHAASDKNDKVTWSDHARKVRDVISVLSLSAQINSVADSTGEKTGMSGASKDAGGHGRDGITSASTLSAEPDDVPNYEAAARALGFRVRHQDGKWWHPSQQHFVKSHDTAAEIFDWYFGKGWGEKLSAPPDDVQSALEQILKHATAPKRMPSERLDKIEALAKSGLAALRSAPVSAAAHPFIEVPLTLLYKNHRDEVAVRNVFPISVRFGTTEWHPEAQWLLRAFDREKQAEREFAMGDINPPAAPPVRDRNAIARLIDPDAFESLERTHVIPTDDEFRRMKSAKDKANAILSHVQSSAAVGVTREALIEKEAQRRCLDAEYTLDRLAFQDRRFRHDDRRPWWRAYFKPTVCFEIEKLERAGFAISPAPDATVSDIDPAEIWEDYCNETSEARRSPQGALAFGVDAALRSSPQEIRREAKSLLDPVVDSRNGQEEAAVSARDAVIEALKLGIHWAQQGGKDAEGLTKIAACNAVKIINGAIRSSKGLSEQAQWALTELRRKEVLSCCTSFVQRKLQIGYNPASRIMDELEEGGYISPADNVGIRHWPTNRAALVSRLKED